MNKEAGSYDEFFRAAVQSCWSAREDARTRQIAKALVKDVGLRAGVTSGKHLNALVSLVARIFIDAGMPREAIHSASRVALPGFYRPEKKWDLIVVHEGELVASVELKSILGSYGNNMNNRSEEAIGNAHDLLQAYEEGLLPANARPPWLGYLFVMQRDEKSTRPVSVVEPHFSTDSEFKDSSYLVRAEVLLRRLIQNRLYSGACLVSSDGSGPEAIQEPASDLTFSKFVAGIMGRVAETLA